MQQAGGSPLLAWQSFYVITGTAAAALTGLVFIVITLAAGDEARRSHQPTEAGIAAFSTPTIMHFGFVLLISAILSAPWQALWNVDLLLDLAGFAGVAYAIIAIRRLRRMPTYQPVWEDWLWYGVCPLVAYLALVVAAVMLPGRPVAALFGIGAVVMLLIFLGIRNAWDLVTYTTLMRMQKQTTDRDS